MPKIIFLIFILFTVSCAKTPAKKTFVPKKVQKIQKSKLTFVEMEKLKALESYRLMRLKAIKLRAKRKKARSRRRRNTKSYSKKYIKKYSRIKPNPIKKIIPSYPKRDPEEIMIEVNQNLTYFCMQKRKSRKFKIPEDCQVFAQEQLLECQTKHIEIDNARIVHCVKRRLKL